MRRSSKSRLTPKQLSLFPGDHLFDRIARSVCRAGVLPAKELFEAWEVARRIRRKYRGGRVVDLASGHGLLAQIMLVLDDSSPEAVAIDTAFPPSARKLAAKMTATWPRLQNRIHFVTARIEAFALTPDDLVVAVHACGALTDRVIDRAVAAGARIAVLPCCHDLKTADTGGLEGWIDGPLAVDVVRARRLQTCGYEVLTRTIPADITPQNRLLLGRPRQKIA
jgi:hypothetical protein